VSGAHNRVFLGVYVKVLRDLNIDSVVVCSDPDSCRSSLIGWGLIPNEVTIREYRNPFADTIPGRWEYLRTIVDQFEEESEQQLRLFIPSLDLFVGEFNETLSGAKKVGIKWWGLFLRLSMDGEGINNWDKFKILEGLAGLEFCQGFMFFDEVLVEILEQRAALRGKIYRMPEIVLDQISIGSSVTIQKPKIIVAGHLTRNKNLIRFVRVAQSCELDWEFYLLGKFEPYAFSVTELQELTLLISNSKVNTDFITGGLINDEDYYKTLQEASVIFAVYTDFPYSSNVLSHAAKFAIPVVTQNRYLMGKRVLRFGIGAVANENNEVDIMAALKRAMKLKGTRQFEKNCKDYIAFQSKQILLEAFQRLISHE